MINISIRKMRIYLAAIEHGSFTKASVSQNISQPAATIIVNQIEETFDCELFVRQGATRKAVVTAVGQKVAETFSRVVANYDNELMRIGNIQSGRGTVKKVMVQSSYDSVLDHGWFAELAFLLDADEIEVDLMPRKDILENIQARDASIGLVDGTVDNVKLDYYALADFEVVLVISEDSDLTMASSGQIDWEELSERCLILADFNPWTTKQIRELSRTSDGSSAKITKVGGISLLAALMQANDYAAIIPEPMYEKIRAYFECKKIRFSDTPLTAGFGIVAPWGHLAQMALSELRSKSCFTDHSKT